MSKSVAAVNSAADTFGSLISKVNTLVTLANTEMVTANSAGALTVGTGFVQGVFGANTIVASTVQGGNTSVAANVAVISNTYFQANVVANTGISVGNTGMASINAFSYSTSTTAQQPLDTFATAAWRSGKYVISIKDPSQPRYQATEILLMQDGTSAYSTEYATLTSNGSLATFAADVSAGNCRLLITPAVAALNINVQRVLNAA